PTRVTNNSGEELLPLTLVDAPAIGVDGTPPSVVQGTIASCYPSVAAAEAAAVAATSASDNCPDGLAPSVSTVGTCSATITVAYTDCAGNSASAVYHTRIDGTPPTLTCPSTSATYCSIPADPVN